MSVFMASAFHPRKPVIINFRRSSAFRAALLSPGHDGAAKKRSCSKRLWNNFSLKKYGRRGSTVREGIG
jgi:hypothetical protein